MIDTNVFLYPYPQEAVWHKGSLFCKGFYLTLADLKGFSEEIPAEQILAFFKDKGMPVFVSEGCHSVSENAVRIYLNKDADIASQAYILNIDTSAVEISCSERSGLFYGLVTLYQLWFGQKTAKDTAVSFPCCTIRDYPDLKTRGFLMDISRGKVPTLDTVKHVIDLLALFKYNHFELYIEGFSFAYPSFKHCWEGQTPMTPEEFRELNLYCRQRCIDFVPNQNCFGHMTSWLARPEYRHLAELEDGLQIGSVHMASTTVDAGNAEAIQLIDAITADLLPNFTSKYFHVDMDEPFELGMGKNKLNVETKGKGAVYLGHMKKIYEVVQKYNRTMLMWGDEIARYPEILKDIPSDVIINDWGYEAEHPFDRHARVLSESGHRFLLSPGTNSWSTFTGLTDNMIRCICSSIEASLKYGGEGIMLTDWGDNGHLQYLSVSYAPVAFAGAASWNSDTIRQNDNADQDQIFNVDQALAEALNLFVFEDSEKIMGQFVLVAGRYYKKEEFLMPCRTRASGFLSRPDMGRANYENVYKTLIGLNNQLLDPVVSDVYQDSYDHRKEADIPALMVYLEDLRQQLKKAKPSCQDHTLVIEEYDNALKMVELLSAQRNACMSEPGAEGDSDILAAMEPVIFCHEKLWLSRNKKSDLDQGVRMLEIIGQKRV